MARRVLPSCLAARSTSTARPDRRVYLHFDGYGRGASWPIADYGEQGIFTMEQQRLLGSRFDLSQTLASELSLYIGNTLDIESVMNLTSVSRDKSVKTAEEALRRAVRHARQDARRRSNLVDVLLECSSLFADDPADAALLDHTRTLAGNSDTSLHNLLDAAETILACPGSAAILAPDDRRKVWDSRRVHVVRSCCYIWMDAGRPLTYTTRDDRLPKEQRDGPLFDLIRTVMEMLLPDGGRPADETIRKDIDRFRIALKEHPELLDEK